MNYLNNDMVKSLFASHEEYLILFLDLRREIDMRFPQISLH
jgi:hypothetical protein